VQRLNASCLNDACRHQGLVDVSGYPADTEVPWFRSREVRQVRRPGQQGSMCGQIERAAAKREPHGQGVAVSRTILFDAIFAIVFAEGVRFAGAAVHLDRINSVAHGTAATITFCILLALSIALQHLITM
jgi:hypothetical protein